MVTTDLEHLQQVDLVKQWYCVKIFLSINVT